MNKTHTGQSSSRKVQLSTSEDKYVLCFLVSFKESHSIHSSRNTSFITMAASSTGGKKIPQNMLKEGEQSVLLMGQIESHWDTVQAHKIASVLLLKLWWELRVQTTVASREEKAWRWSRVVRWVHAETENLSSTGARDQWKWTGEEKRLTSFFYIYSAHRKGRPPICRDNVRLWNKHQFSHWSWDSLKVL